MIREERDPAWWSMIASDPVAGPMFSPSGRSVDFAALFAGARVLPLATVHGGYLLHNTDSIGLVWDLHALYRPEGWGKEAHRAGSEAMARLFREGAQVCVAYERHPASRPPLSFGFRQGGNWSMVHKRDYPVRCWVLTQRAWEASPAGRRMLRWAH